MSYQCEHFVISFCTNSVKTISNFHDTCTIADRGRAQGAMAPGPVKISHKNDGWQRWPHRFHVSCPPTRPLDPLLLHPIVWHFVILYSRCLKPLCWLRRKIGGNCWIVNLLISILYSVPDFTKIESPINDGGRCLQYPDSTASAIEWIGIVTFVTFPSDYVNVYSLLAHAVSWKIWRNSKLPPPPVPQEIVDVPWW